MSTFRLFHLAGSFNRLSAAGHVSSMIEARYAVASERCDLNDVGPSRGKALRRGNVRQQALHADQVSIARRRTA